MKVVGRLVKTIVRKKGGGKERQKETVVKDGKPRKKETRSMPHFYSFQPNRALVTPSVKPSSRPTSIKFLNQSVKCKVMMTAMTASKTLMREVGLGRMTVVACG